jgi:hypothetical protein
MCCSTLRWSFSIKKKKSLPSTPKQRTHLAYIERMASGKGSAMDLWRLIAILPLKYHPDIFTLPLTWQIDVATTGAEVARSGIRNENQNLRWEYRYTATATDILKLIETFGKIAAAHVFHRWQETFCFMLMMNESDTENAVEALNGREFFSRELVVEWAAKQRPVRGGKRNEHDARNYELADWKPAVTHSTSGRWQ